MRGGARPLGLLGERGPHAEAAAAGPGPADLVRVAINERRVFGVDRGGHLYRWDLNHDRGEPQRVASGVADVFLGLADGSQDSLCVLTEAGAAQCHRRQPEGELGEPWWTVPESLEVWIGPRHFCVRTAAELSCRPTHGFTGDEDMTLDAEGATGFLFEYEHACVLRPDGPTCVEGFDPSEQLGGTHPSWAMTGWKDDRWGTCAQVDDALQCRMGTDWKRTTVFEGRPTRVGMGKDFACALCGSSVSCWGEVLTLGLAGEGTRGLAPIEGLAGVTELYGGRSRLGEGMCARTDQGLHCWGPAARGVRNLSEPEEGLRPEDLTHTGPCELADGVATCREGWRVPVTGVLELVQDSEGRCVRTAREVICFDRREESARFRVQARDIDMDGRVVCAATAAGELQCAVIGGDWALLQQHWEPGEGLKRVGDLSGVTHVALNQTYLCAAHGGRVSCLGARQGNRLHDGGTFAAEPIAVPLADAFP